MGTQRNASSKVINGIRDMKVYEWSTVGVLDNGVKVIQKNDTSKASAPYFSHSSTEYAIFHPEHNEIDKIVYYNAEKAMTYELHWNHDHHGNKKGNLHLHFRTTDSQRLDYKITQKEIDLYNVAMEYNKRLKSSKK